MATDIETKADDSDVELPADVDEHAGAPADADADADADKSASEAQPDDDRAKVRKTAGVVRRRRPSTSGDSTRRRPSTLVALLAAAAVILAAAAGFFGYHYFAGDDAAAADGGDRAVVATTAVDFATKFASFDYRALDQSTAEIADMSTKEFASRYDEMLKAFTDIVSNGKGEATAKVSHSAVETLESDKATVIMFVDQRATNVVAPEGKNQAYRMLLSLKKVDGRWLVDDLQTV